MKCRIDIIGHKIWNDPNNASRPPQVEIVLYRDGEIYKTAIVDSNGDGEYRFVCLLKRASDGHEYIYTVDEAQVPDGYVKTLRDYDVINTLDVIDIDCVKTWNDRNNVESIRPASITVNLLQNGVLFRSLEVDSPPDDEDTAAFRFENVPFADANGTPFVYSINELDIPNYSNSIVGYHITNNEIIVP